MAKPKRITKNGNPWRWRWRSLKNWFYDKWMRMRGYTPTTFRPFDNAYNYEKRSEIDKALVMQEKEPVHEIVGYMKKKDIKSPWYHFEEQRERVADDHGRQEALELLRQGKDEDARIIRRPLPRE
jgi:hypothetical protein